MKYEVLEKSGEWIVLREGVELARFVEQLQALKDIARRLGDAAPVEGSTSLALRYQHRPDRAA